METFADPWAFLQGFQHRLSNDYTIRHIGDKQTYVATKDPRHRPILTATHDRTGKTHHVLAISQPRPDANLARRLRSIIEEHASKREYTVLLPLQGPHNHLEPLKSSPRYNSPNPEYAAAFSNAPKSEIAKLHLINEAEQATLIPIDGQYILQRTSAKGAIEHYRASTFTDKEGDERGDVLSLEKVILAAEGWPAPSRDLISPGSIGILTRKDDPYTPGLLVPAHEQRWGDYLSNTIAPAYGKTPRTRQKA